MSATPQVIKNEITSENIRRRSKHDDDTDDDAWKLQEGHMCPAWIASTADGRRSRIRGRNSGGVYRQVQKSFQSEWSRSVSENKGEMIWQQAKRETRSSRKGISP